jgi:hypothetical protein
MKKEKYLLLAQVGQFILEIIIIIITHSHEVIVVQSRLWVPQRDSPIECAGSQKNTILTSRAYPIIFPSLYIYCLDLEGLARLLLVGQMSRKVGHCARERTQERKRENSVIGLSSVVFCTQEGTHPPRSLTLDYRSPHTLSLSLSVSLPALCCNELQRKGGLCNPTRHKGTDGTEVRKATVN